MKKADFKQARREYTAALVAINIAEEHDDLTHDAAEKQREQLRADFDAKYTAPRPIFGNPRTENQVTSETGKRAEKRTQKAVQTFLGWK